MGVMFWGWAFWVGTHTPRHNTQHNAHKTPQKNTRTRVHEAKLAVQHRLARLEPKRAHAAVDAAVAERHDVAFVFLFVCACACVVLVACVSGPQCVRGRQASGSAGARWRTQTRQRPPPPLLRAAPPPAAAREFAHKKRTRRRPLLRAGGKQDAAARLDLLLGHLDEHAVALGGDLRRRGVNACGMGARGLF